jgi:hypothetical protein
MVPFAISDRRRFCRLTTVFSDKPEGRVRHRILNFDSFESAVIRYSTCTSWVVFLISGVDDNYFPISKKTICWVAVNL